MGRAPGGRRRRCAGTRHDVDPLAPFPRPLPPRLAPPGASGRSWPALGRGACLRACVFFRQ
eukprot:2686036-Pyramimonas_sp.AAC.1